MTGPAQPTKEICVSIKRTIATAAVTGSDALGLESFIKALLGHDRVQELPSGRRVTVSATEVDIATLKSRLATQCHIVPVAYGTVDA